jgi:hypothetical protein
MMSALLILAAALLGWIVVQTISPRTETIETIALSYPLGSGLLTYSLFLASWGGIPSSIVSLVILYLILLAGAIVIGARIHRDRPGQRWWLPAPGIGVVENKLRILPFVIISGLSIVAGYLSLLRFYSTWDAIGIWAVKGIGIARGGTIFAASEWGSHGLAYPLNIPLQIASFAFFGEGLLQSSKLIFPLYYFSLLLGVYALLRKRQGEAYSILGSLLVGSMPIVFEHAMIGYANLPFTNYIVLGGLYLYGTAIKKGASREVLAGLLLGLATWTRPEGIFVVLGGIFVAVVFQKWSRSKILPVMQTLILILVVAAPWQAFLQIHAQPRMLEQLVLVELTCRGILLGCPICCTGHLGSAVVGIARSSRCVNFFRADSTLEERD